MGFFDAAYGMIHRSVWDTLHALDRFTGKGASEAAAQWPKERPDFVRGLTADVEAFGARVAQADEEWREFCESIATLRKEVHNLWRLIERKWRFLR